MELARVDVAIVGGGPAGLIAAERLAASGRDVTVFDRMPTVGRKFLLAGRGGLNITHSEPLPPFRARYGPAAPWLAPALDGFGPAALRDWCESLGEPTVVGSSGRVFPASWKATPLLRAWLRRLAGAGVAVRTGHRWLGLGPGGEQRFETAAGPLAVHARATLLALGGASWPRLGSDGAWVVALADAAPITPLQPSNVGIRCDWSEPFRIRFAGSPLKRIAARIGSHVVRGEAVITQTGLEGGAIYALSRPIRDALDGGGTTLEMDLRPDLDDAALARRMGGPAVSRANAWRRAGLSPAAAALGRELGGTPKRVLVPVAGLAPIERAISTAGGLARAGLDDRLMLRRHPGLFAAGEMLDWDAPTGGYLLQATFATGWHAAGGMLDWLKDAASTA